MCVVENGTNENTSYDKKQMTRKVNDMSTIADVATITVRSAKPLRS